MEKDIYNIGLININLGFRTEEWSRVFRMWSLRFFNKYINKYLKSFLKN